MLASGHVSHSGLGRQYILPTSTMARFISLGSHPKVSSDANHQPSQLPKFFILVQLLTSWLKAKDSPKYSSHVAVNDTCFLAEKHGGKDGDRVPSQPVRALILVDGGFL
jgi:hypothetical protein